jgi:hypothetical protein
MIRLNLVRIADSVGAFEHLVPGDGKVIWELSVKAIDKDNGELTNRVERLTAHFCNTSFTYSDLLYMFPLPT